MKRLFGFRKKKKERKERLSPPEATAPGNDGFQATISSPMYQYARNEFAQTVGAGTSNDDGRGILYKSPSDTPGRLFSNNSDHDNGRDTSMVANAASSPRFHSNTSTTSTWMSPPPMQPTTQHQTDSDQHSYYTSPAGAQQSQSRPVGTSEAHQQQPLNVSGSLPTTTRSNSSSLIDGQVQPNRSLASSLQDRQGALTPSYQPPQDAAMSQQTASPEHNSARPGGSNTNSNTIDPDYLAACSASNLGRQESLFSQASSQYPTNNTNQAATPSSNQTANNNNNNYYNSQYFDYPPTIVMPDATYEEEYGDAYIGGPIRYVYPSGYQSMRPRSGPWKLSIVICILFTWLSVFIVGHCSDYVDSDVSQYNQNEIDDDTLVIETRWCGSRLLYMMWAISMLVTGLAAAYCSIIGYIKVRDFAVANSRSQPPGMMGKTDFYAQIDDANAPPPIQETSSQGSSSTSQHRNRYNYPLYQADGNPQFWGGHIYRPTQAAVAITSR